MTLGESSYTLWLIGCVFKRCVNMGVSQGSMNFITLCLTKKCCKVVGSEFLGRSSAHAYCNVILGDELQFDTSHFQVILH
jgi:hypothetical protein